MGKPWTFQQSGGPKRTLVLGGEAAPHGRPRQKPVVSDGIKLRRSRTYYPDKKGPPTTHIFGIQYEPWELEGRFNDRYLGKGGCKAAIKEWLTFVADQQPIVVTWGDILSARGFVYEFMPGRESEDQCTYKITLDIDEEPDIVSAQSSVIGVDTPQVLCQGLVDELAEVTGLPSTPEAFDMSPSFLDTLEAAVDNINSFSASLLNIAQQVDDFQSATIDQLERLRAGVVQSKTAIIKLRNAFDAGANDLALIADNADMSVSWSVLRSSSDVSTALMMAALDDLDRQAEIAQRGQLMTVYVVAMGDTWESISTQFYGGPSGAGRLREANGITFGQLPVAGRQITIPQAP